MVTRAAFAAAVFLYAAFSSPTPDAPGIVEFAVLALLLFAATSMRLPRDRWAYPFFGLLAYGTIIPLAIGALSGHASGDIARDVIAFAALAVPVVYASQFPDDQKSQNTLLALLIGVGMLFSLRYLAQAWRDISALGVGSLDHHFLYLANSPLVAFAAAFLLLRGCFTEKRVLYAFGFILASLIPLAAMIGMMQRATLGLLVFAWFGFLIYTLIKTPRRAAAVIAVCAGIIALLWPLPTLVWESLSEKTLAVGWNARGAELAVMMDAVNANPVTALFGAGWGSLFKSPAVGDLWVRFTHSLFTSLLWKAGWLGLIMAAAAFAGLVMDATRRLKADPVLLAALILPLLPALFLYGSYKSLCFGLLLLALARCNGHPLKQSDKPIPLI